MITRFGAGAGPEATGYRRFESYRDPVHRGLDDQRLRDLGALPGDGNTSGLGINDQGVITGISAAADFSSFRAFVWSGGVMMDLNQLSPRTPRCIC